MKHDEIVEVFFTIKIKIMKFKVGDRVKCQYGIGTIKKIEEDKEHAVEFDSYIFGHSCYGICKNGYGFYVDEDDLELIEEDYCLYFSDEVIDKIANILKSGIKTKKQFQKELNILFSSEPTEEPKPIKQNRLEELINALNTFGSLGIELDVKITAEINGKKVEL